MHQLQTDERTGGETVQERQNETQVLVALMGLHLIPPWIRP